MFDKFTGLFSGKGKKNAQINKQAQTIDQNYANNILFMALSSLETLQHKIINRVQSNANKNNSLQSHQKEFGRYDKHDYSYKEQIQIKGQLMNNVMLLANSKMAFELTYGKGSYQLPKNYNQERVLNRLAIFKNNFYNLKDQICYLLTEDIEKILAQNKTTGLSYETMIIQDPYQGKTNNKQFLQGAVVASEQMRQEQQKVKSKYGEKMDPKNLQFQENTNFTSKDSQTSKIELQ